MIMHAVSRRRRVWALSPVYLLVAGLFAHAAPADAQVSFNVLYEFSGGQDGAAPRGLIEGTDGNFYGTTRTGGGACAFAEGCGTVFRMTPDGSVTILYAFTDGLDGSYPAPSLIQATDGNFYGTTEGRSGSGVCLYGCGAAFQMTPDGTVTILHAFSGGFDGATPRAGLVQGSDGNFYGTTSFGGGVFPICPHGCGTVFQLTPDGTVTILYAFTGGLFDGIDPGTLIQASDGNFYGTSFYGGIFCRVDEHIGCGTAFQMTPDGTVTVLHRFDGGLEGANPSALIQAADGTFYGTTLTGGDSGCPPPFLCGTVFQMMADGNVAGVHSFVDVEDGRDPAGSLIQGSDGNFYGTALHAGDGSDSGTVFQITPDGTFKTLYVFEGGHDGAHPLGLIQASDGTLYGTSESNNDLNSGTIFQIALDRLLPKPDLSKGYAERGPLDPPQL
jgi:uncharacterized repeat protein (TIGR03803 family)